MNLKFNPKIQQAFTLVEVMVALVVFSIGLLGLAGLQSLGMQNNQTAFFRTLAMQQAYNMSNRMRENIVAVDAGNYNAIPKTAGALGTNCITSTCTPSALASFDQFEWNTNNAALLPGGQGTVTKDGADQFVICVMWNELKVPAPAMPDCLAIPSTYNPKTQFKFYALRIEL